MIRDAGKPRSILSGYVFWMVGLFVCPGLHRFYLGHPRSGTLMVALVLSAFGLATLGVWDIYSHYIGLLTPGSLAGMSQSPYEMGKKWFAFALIPAAAVIGWMLIDLFLIPGMARRSRERG